MSSGLSSMLASNHPIPQSAYSGTSIDLDMNGTPVIFQPPGVGCSPLAAIQAKSGALYLYSAEKIGNGPVAQFQLAPSTYADGFLGSPAYSPVTGLLYAAVPSSNDSLFPPGLVAINPGCASPSVQWNSAFGPDSYSSGSTTSPGIPRSVPAVSAGGVVFVGTTCTWTGSACAATAASTSARLHSGLRRPAKPLICCAPPGTSGGAEWAIDATTGNVLNGGAPILLTNQPIRMPATIDGNWVFVLDNGGNLYGLTIDPSYAAKTTVYKPRNPREQDALAAPRR